MLLIFVVSLLVGGEIIKLASKEIMQTQAAFMAKAGLNCVVPKVKWDKSTERVLTMEFEEGFKSTDVESIEKAGLDKR